MGGGDVGDDVAADVGGKGKGGVFSDLSVLLANGGWVQVAFAFDPWTRKASLVLSS